MNVEYVLFIAVPIVIITFIVLGYIVMLNIKKKMANSKIEKFSIKSDKKITLMELNKVIKYMEKNKKYISPSIYRTGKYKIEQVKTRVVA